MASVITSAFTVLVVIHETANQAEWTNPHYQNVSKWTPKKQQGQIWELQWKFPTYSTDGHKKEITSPSSVGSHGQRSDYQLFNLEIDQSIFCFLPISPPCCAGVQRFVCSCRCQVATSPDNLNVGGNGCEILFKFNREWKFTLAAGQEGGQRPIKQKEGSLQ